MCRMHKKLTGLSKTNDLLLMHSCIKFSPKGLQPLLACLPLGGVLKEALICRKGDAIFVLILCIIIGACVVAIWLMCFVEMCSSCWASLQKRRKVFPVARSAVVSSEVL